MIYLGVRFESYSNKCCQNGIIWDGYVRYFKGHTICFIKESYYRQENHPSNLAQGTQHESMLERTLSRLCSMFHHRPLWNNKTREQSPNSNPIYKFLPPNTAQDSSVSWGRSAIEAYLAKMLWKGMSYTEYTAVFLSVDLTKTFFMLILPQWTKPVIYYKIRKKICLWWKRSMTLSWRCQDLCLGLSPSCMTWKLWPTLIRDILGQVTSSSFWFIVSPWA